MLLIHIFILALVQGVTEFLPISSSGHLVLVHNFIEYPISEAWNNALVFDIAVHIGTLFAALIYFRQDVKFMLCNLFKTIKERKLDPQNNLLLHVIVASLPVVVFGYIVYQIDPSWNRSLHLMAWCTLIFGILLWLSDKYRPADKKLENISYKESLIIGIAQALALIPGASRSGVTITAARYLGINRTDAARYSMLLAIVAISGAGTLSGVDLLKINQMVEIQNLGINIDLMLAAFLSFLFGYAAISLMMKWLTKASYTPFVIYRVCLGVLLLGLLYGGVIN